MLQWLEGIGIASNAFDELKRGHAALHAMREQPELAAAKTNVAALRELLHMSDRQVRSAHAFACCCETNAATLVPVLRGCRV